MKYDEKELFERMPVLKAVIALAIPTVVSQLITIIYNMADTFFIGQTGDANQVAAANLCMPLFFFLNGFANLFGIGGASLISRSLGVNDKDKARRTSAFCIWTSMCIALIYGITIYSLSPKILPLLGANNLTYDFCHDYLLWTVGFGAIPTVLNMQLAHLIRSEGCSKQASFGMILGAILNIMLDPIFIFVFKLDVAGAAMATMISNSIASIYFFTLIIIKNIKKHTNLTLNPKYYSVKDGIPKEVFLVGFPSAVMSLMAMVANIVLNKLLASYSNEAIAGIGIAKKIDMLAFGIATGMSQGVIPLIGYNFAQKNTHRMKKAIKTTLVLSLSVTIVCAIILFTCAPLIVKAFIDDELTIHYGGRFQRIMCITGPCVAITLTIMTIYQSIGKRRQPMLLSMLRKGGFDIPAMLILNSLLGVDYIVWGVPIADFLAMIVAIIMFVPFYKHKLVKLLNVNNNPILE